MIDAQTLARQAGFSKFHQRQLRHLIARLARLAYSDGLEDAACECEWAKPVEPTMDALAAGIRAMKTPNPRILGEAIEHPELPRTLQSAHVLKLCDEAIAATRRQEGGE
jgi:hypothetical protein